MNKSYQNVAGISLLEIALALVLVSFLGTAGINSWRQYQQQLKLAAVSGQLLTFLIRVQSVANWMNGNYRLQTYDDGSRMRLRVIDVDNQRPLSKFDFKSAEKTVRLEEFSLASPVIFYGRRNMASPGHFILSNGSDSIRIVVSARGRIRRCTQAADKTARPVLGVPLC